jgi:hypothetical protein
VGTAVCLIVAWTSGKGVGEDAGKASLSHCMLMTPPWPGNSRDCKTSAVWALFCAWPLWGVSQEQGIRAREVCFRQESAEIGGKSRLLYHVTMLN